MKLTEFNGLSVKLINDPTEGSIVTYDGETISRMIDDGDYVTPTVIDGDFFFRNHETFDIDYLDEIKAKYINYPKFTDFCVYMRRLNMTPVFRYDGKLTLVNIRRLDGMQMLKITGLYLAKCYKLDVDWIGVSSC